MTDQKTTETATPLEAATKRLEGTLEICADVKAGMRGDLRQELDDIRTILDALTAAQSRLEAQKLREAELAKALKDLRGATEHYWPTDVPSSIRLTEAEWAADVALQSPRLTEQPQGN